MVKKTERSKKQKTKIHSTQLTKNYFRCFYFLNRFKRDFLPITILNIIFKISIRINAQINLSMDNAWGVVRCIIDVVRKQKEGKYLIVKDPNKPVIRLYDVPDNTFESEESSDGDDDDDADGKGGFHSGKR